MKIGAIIGKSSVTYDQFEYILRGGQLIKRNIYGFTVKCYVTLMVLDDFGAHEGTEYMGIGVCKKLSGGT